eukprot:9843869-Lingulodinium_polyedra.AAC.1
MLAVVVFAACLLVCRATDDEDGESVTRQGSSMILSLAIAWAEFKPRICRLSGLGSNDPSPL